MSAEPLLPWAVVYRLEGKSCLQEPGLSEPSTALLRAPSARAWHRSFVTTLDLHSVSKRSLSSLAGQLSPFFPHMNTVALHDPKEANSWQLIHRNEQSSLLLTLGV